MSLVIIRKWKVSPRWQLLLHLKWQAVNVSIHLDFLSVSEIGLQGMLRRFPSSLFKMWSFKDISRDSKISLSSSELEWWRISVWWNQVESQPRCAIGVPQSMMSLMFPVTHTEFDKLQEHSCSVDLGVGAIIHQSNPKHLSIWFVISVSYFLLNLV